MMTEMKTFQRVAVAALFLAAASIVGWPGLPPSMTGAAAAAAIVVAAVWIGGTRALMERTP